MNAIYEDELPEDMTDKEYDLWFKLSSVRDGVRVGPDWNAMLDRIARDVLADSDQMQPSPRSSPNPTNGTIQ